MGGTTAQGRSGRDDLCAGTIGVLREFPNNREESASFVPLRGSDG
ncbi:MAG TPA: hypothetical protein VMU41_16665 [Candidatus Binataceae bacterium]|nr:hypothetical protein [Candidatus Binataceae bacterium]